MKEPLFGKNLKELVFLAKELKLPPYSPQQMADWLYQKKVSSFEEMTNLSKTARQTLKKRFCIGVAPPVSMVQSTDGTKKYLFKTRQNSVETAWIPEEKRGTLCVSTQMGCRRGCLFCMTARQGFQGNLSAGEILDQYRSLPESSQVTHFVFMGMGEPLDNLDNVLKSLEILTAYWGFAFSPHKITVSTIGVLEGLKRFIQETECNLALSVHSPFPEERASLIPYERRYPLSQILTLLKTYPWGRNRRLTMEYLMLHEQNDTPDHAKKLAELLEGIRTRVNLIPFHPIPNFSGQPSSPPRLEAFKNILTRRGLVTTVRRSRGLDIEAACGLLSTKAS